MYFAYSNISCEGVVVVKDNDRRFPIGVDPMTGGIRYVNTLEEALKHSTLIREVEDMREAVKFDSAGYPRYAVDIDESELYRRLLSIEWEKSILANTENQ